MRKLFILVVLMMSVSLIYAQEKNVDESVSFNKIQKPPTYPGCSGDNAALKKCFNRSIQKHFARNFNPGLLNNSAYNSVNKKFFILFRINKDGGIDSIQVKRSPHERLKEESIRVIRLLPKITPGEIKGKSVAVTYVFPFSMKDKTNPKKN